MSRLRRCWHQLRDALLVTVLATLFVTLAFQVKTNNVVADRQHDSCVSRRQIAVESKRRQYVLQRFLIEAAKSRQALATQTSLTPAVRRINAHAAHEYRGVLLPMIHTIPIPPPC